MGWAGWGAGPAGAGAAGGPSRWFLALLFVGCAGCTVLMAVTRNWLGTGVGAVVTLWFFARLFLGVGQPKPDDQRPPDPPADPPVPE